MEKWRGLLKSDGWQLLREALDGPIRFTRDGSEYRFSGSLRMGAPDSKGWWVVHLSWCARQDSNLRPLAPEANALSS